MDSTKARSIGAAVGALILVVIGGLFIFNATYDLTTGIADATATTTGTVVDVHTGKSAHSEVHYAVGGRTYSIDSSNIYAKGDAVTVSYVPNQPDTGYDMSSNPTREAWVQGAFGVLFVAVLPPLLLYRFGSVPRWARRKGSHAA